LMELPQISNKAHFNGGAVEGLSREASGLCFDFPIHDGTQYYAGTEDGLLHLCSVSYNEQTLENYYGHTAAVYRVKCSPFLPHVFLSCSADWTCLLWNGKEQGDKKWTMRFQSGFDYVTAIDWSPHNSCVFAIFGTSKTVQLILFSHTIFQTNNFVALHGLLMRLLSLLVLWMELLIAFMSQM
jgi:WD40 repeat protein